MEVVDTLRKGEEEPWRVLEFYSGIGGMRYSIIKAGVKATMVEAFDINDKANDVYQHNFSRRPYQGNIQSLTAAELDKYKAHAWLLSPPCQPYTRQGLQKDSGDARASSFLKILDLVPHMSSPPLMLFVENVVGFETSDTHNQMMEIFRSIGFTTQEYILTPLQFGVPYSRPRYFCLAKKEPLSFQNPHVNNQLLWTPGPLMENDSTTWIDDHSQSHGRWEEWLESCKTVESFLEFSTCKYQPEAAKSEIRHNNDASPKFSQTLEKCSEEENCLEKCSEEENCSSNSYLNKYTVPLSLIERWGSAMDIVYPHSKRCCCFTKSYYRYVKGTGSLLASREPQKDTKSLLKEQGLRYFTPREVANLHSLPKDFHFPQHISLKQQYALLGNSLSIAVVAPLLRYLFTEPSLIMQKEIIEREFN